MSSERRPSLRDRFLAECVDTHDRRMRHPDLEVRFELARFFDQGQSRGPPRQLWWCEVFKTHKPPG